MNYRSFISFFALIVLVFIGLVSGSGCANMIPPQGGPKDTLPPVIRHITPLDSTRHFTGDKISIVFDEYVDLDNYQQNLIVSPLPAAMPNVTRKLNELTIKLRDSLEPNTTYSLNFGNTIKDINEGNVLKDYTYIFSTGSQIDSLQLSGNVVLAETGDIDTTLTVMLHRSKDDSVVIKDKPRYIAKLDKNGNFRFKNLPPGTYYLYALQDEGGGYRYMSRQKLFAFADSAVVINGNTTAPTLHAYAEPTPPAKPAASTNTGRGRTVDKRLKFTTSLKEGQQGLLEPLMLLFEVPLISFDSSRIRLTQDSTYSPVQGYSWQLDSLKKTVTLKYAWKESTSYHLIMEKDFAFDSLKQQLLKGDTVNFKTKSMAEYGRFLFRFRNLDLSQNPVLQIIQSNQIVQSYPITAAILSQPLFLPGEYGLRILHDTNKNGKWDPGEFVGKHRQPELVTPIQRTVNIRSNFDNEYELDVTPRSNANAIPPSSGYPTTPVRNNRPGLR